MATTQKRGKARAPQVMLSRLRRLERDTGTKARPPARGPRTADWCRAEIRRLEAVLEDLTPPVKTWIDPDIATAWREQQQHPANALEASSHQ